MQLCLSFLQGVEVQRVRVEGPVAGGQVGVAARPRERAQVGVGAHQARKSLIKYTARTRY